MGYHAYEPFITDLSTAAEMKLYPRKVATGDKLYIYANQTDAYPFILLPGNSNAKIVGANRVYLNDGNSGSDTFSFWENLGDCIISAESSNGNLSLVPNGTGVVKFGTHAALSGESLSGYITIKDAGGTARKLGVIS